jgi:PilZ domain-containing protein
MVSSRENRRFRRVRPSGLVSSTATIIVAPGKPTIGCTVIDLSAGGACLDLANPDQLPRRFTLLHGATRKSCLVMWKKFRRIGVQF